MRARGAADVAVARPLAATDHRDRFEWPAAGVRLAEVFDQWRINR
jgi:hypothetical protein